MKREQEIKRLAEHSEQFRNELTGYENSQVNVSVMLKKNSGYKNLYLYQWLKEDIREFLERGKALTPYLYFIPHILYLTIMDILKNIDELLISWGTAPSFGRYARSVYSFCACAYRCFSG